SNLEASAELYNPATGLWSGTAGMNTPRERHTATLLSTGQVLVAGGAPSFSLFSPAAQTSAELYTLPSALNTPTPTGTATRTPTATATATVTNTRTPTATPT